MIDKSYTAGDDQVSTYYYNTMMVWGWKCYRYNAFDQKYLPKGGNLIRKLILLHLFTNN